MISPEHWANRARLILRECGGDPTREQLKNPTPAVSAAWDAYHVIWYLHLARNRLDFLPLQRGRDVPSLKWHYLAYAKYLKKSKLLIELASDRLRMAEARYAEIKRETA